jgi:hypothetical protein
MELAKRKAFRIRGDVAELRRWPEDVQQAAMPVIVEAGAAGVREEAPKDRGMGHPKSIVRRVGGRVEMAGERGIVYSKAPHSHLHEYGVSPHALNPGSGQRKLASVKRKNPNLVMNIDGEYRRGGNHPGIRANPFMERGLERAEDEIEQALAREGEAALHKRVKKVADLMEDISGLG